METQTATAEPSTDPDPSIAPEPAGRVILAGGTGFLGDILRRDLAAHGYEPIVLTRNPRVAGEVRWDGETLGEWMSHLEDARAVINLAGKSVNCRYNARNRKLIMESRTYSTRVIGEAIQKCRRPPAVWLNSSTATIYRHSIAREQDEDSRDFGSTPEVKDAFSVSVTEAWERVFEAARVEATRKVALRISMVLGTRDETVFRVLRRLTRLGLGGKMGRGDQYVSWIHETDFCRAVRWIIEHDQLEGPVNMSAPHPLPNREMMRCFRRVCQRCVGLPASEWMLEVGAFLMRTETELILKSRRVVPRRLLESGFEFLFPDMEKALLDLESKFRNRIQAI